MHRTDFSEREGHGDRCQRRRGKHILSWTPQLQGCCYYYCLFHFIQQAKLGGKRMARICQKAGHKHIQFRGFQVENMIARTDCRFPIRLEGLACDHKDYVTFGEHLSFPGLIYRYHKQHKDSRNERGVPSDKAVLLIFNTGKIIITGCKSGEEANAVFSEMFPVLLQYRLMPGEKVSDKVVNSDGQTTGCAPTTGNAKPSASSSV
eukprot:GHVU01010452.1.p1 GENE.GHVU01010452.1~~GHVU01010452.1.p1  ORF type:complete len:205 (+),score=17.99 GHVU01010452.1:367-981(+)